MIASDEANSDSCSLKLDVNSQETLPENINFRFNAELEAWEQLPECCKIDSQPYITEDIYKEIID